MPRSRLDETEPNELLKIDQHLTQVKTQEQQQTLRQQAHPEHRRKRSREATLDRAPQKPNTIPHKNALVHEQIQKCVLRLDEDMAPRDALANEKQMDLARGDLAQHD